MPDNDTTSAAADLLAAGFPGAQVDMFGTLHPKDRPVSGYQVPMWTRREVSGHLVQEPTPLERLITKPDDDTEAWKLRNCFYCRGTRKVRNHYGKEEPCQLHP